MIIIHKKYYRHGGSFSNPSPSVATPAYNSQEPSSGTGLTKDVIRKMQSYLASLRYDVGNPGGIAGKKTQKAIFEFQKE